MRLSNTSLRRKHVHLALLFGAVASAASGLPTVANAADSDEWQFNGGPYLWGAGIRGHVGHKSTGTASVKSDFSNIARTVDMSLMFMGEARRGPYSVLADLMYIDTDTRSRLPTGSKLEVEGKTASGFLGGGYTVLGDDDYRVDVAGGVRVWYSSTTLTLHGGQASGHSGSDNATWADAMVGLRGAMRSMSGSGCPPGAWWVPGNPVKTGTWQPWQAGNSPRIFGGGRLPGHGRELSQRRVCVRHRAKGPLLGISGRF